jgi:hypothetical protein
MSKSLPSPSPIIAPSLPPASTAPEQVAFTITEFCARNRISKNAYYTLKARGLGPREMALGRAIRISIEEEAKWRADRSNPKPTEAKSNARKANERVALATRAGKLAAASSRHISKRNARR